MGFLFVERGKKMAKLAGIRGVKKHSFENPLKLTALIYLKEALLKQNYEICREVITLAKEFGASDDEVRDLLEDPRRTPG